MVYIYGHKQANKHMYTHIYTYTVKTCQCWACSGLPQWPHLPTHMCMHTITSVHTCAASEKWMQFTWLLYTCTHALIHIQRDNGQTEGEDPDRGECPVGTSGGRRGERVWSRSHICLLQWYLCPCNRSLRKVNTRLWFVCMVWDYMCWLLLYCNTW